MTSVIFFVCLFWGFFATQTPLQSKKDKWWVLISVTNCVYASQALCSKTKHQQKQKPVYTVWHQPLTCFCVAVLQCVAVWTKCSWLFPSLAGQKTWFFGVKLSLLKGSEQVCMFIWVLVSLQGHRWTCSTVVQTLFSVRPILLVLRLTPFSCSTALVLHGAHSPEILGHIEITAS